MAERKIRYAVVGAGWISQAAFMPGVEHTGNSVMTALVTGDPEKAEALSKKYKIEHVYTYNQYDQMLQDGVVDAVYLALPNSMHLEYSLKTLRAGIHLLLEKPMAVTEDECEQIIRASEESGAKLMIAYRLHFEPANLAAIELVQSGEIGEPRFFSSVFCQKVSEENHRADPKLWAGPLPDMGPYPINAVRNLFRAEPTEVFAFGSEMDSPTRKVIAVNLKFADERVAQFTVGYGENPIDQYRIIGTKGYLEMNPGFGMEDKFTHKLTIGEKTTEKSFKKTDQFGGELEYFSKCIIENIEPEPNGREGLADVRVIKAVERAIQTGQVQKLEEFTRNQRPGLQQEVKLRAVKPPKMVNASEPQKGGSN